MDTNKANHLLKKHGAVELSKSYAGREIIKKAREKYRIDLLQPGDPEFMKYWGHKVIADKLAKESNEMKSREMWGALNERKAWEAQKKAEEKGIWKSKKL